MSSRHRFVRSRRVLGLSALLTFTALPLGSAALAATTGAACQCNGQAAGALVRDAIQADLALEAAGQPRVPTAGIYVNDTYYSGANNIRVKRSQVSYLPQPREQSCLSVGPNSSMKGRAKAQYCEYSSAQSQMQEESAHTRTIDPKMDVYYSDAPAWVAQKKPVVVLIHGGNFRTNDKRNAVNPLRDIWNPAGESCNDLPAAMANGDPSSWALHARSYVCAGYLAVSINYRMRDLTDPPYMPATDVKNRVLRYAGRPGEEFDDRQWEAARNANIKDALDDLGAAITYLKQNADQLGIDPTRIVTVGGSAGGALSMMNALRANQIGADANGFDTTVRAALSTGATLADESNRLLNPAYQLTPDLGDAPILLFHSDPCDCGSGMSWEDNVKPTKSYIENRDAAGKRQGPLCRTLPHNMTDASGALVYNHTMALTLHDAGVGQPGDAFGRQTPNVRRFLYRQLRLCELRGECSAP